MKVEQRTFIVSGGSSGLGLATVHNLLQSNAFVSVLDLSRSSGLPVGLEVKFIKCNITKVEEIENAVEETVKWTAETGAQLGGVVNCAGVGTSAKIVDSKGNPHSLSLWNFTLDVNLSGTFNLTRLALKHLITVSPEQPDGERGVIIMVASSAAFEGQPGQAAYSATKGALASMTLPLSRDLSRYGIRVMTIAPGIFASSMTAKLPEKTRLSLERELQFPNRFGKAEEFAKTVRWILECPFVNGETVRISGASRLPGRL